MPQHHALQHRLVEPRGIVDEFLHRRGGRQIEQARRVAELESRSTGSLLRPRRPRQRARRVDGERRRARTTRKVHEHDRLADRRRARAAELLQVDHAREHVARLVGIDRLEQHVVGAGAHGAQAGVCTALRSVSATTGISSSPSTLLKIAQHREIVGVVRIDIDDDQIGTRTALLKGERKPRKRRHGLHDETRQTRERRLDFHAFRLLAQLTSRIRIDGRRACRCRHHEGSCGPNSSFAHDAPELVRSSPVNVTSIVGSVVRSDWAVRSPVAKRMNPAIIVVAKVS